ncbi:MAG: hypothetical protein U1D30_11925 [Planctomycetota bacterium]
MAPVLNYTMKSIDGKPVDLQIPGEGRPHRQRGEPMWLDPAV